VFKIIMGEDLLKGQVRVVVIGTLLLFVYLAEAKSYCESIRSLVPRVLLSVNASIVSGPGLKGRLIITYESLIVN
jgi:hypothetical protein